MEADPAKACNQDDATGLLRLNTLRLKVAAIVHGEGQTGGRNGPDGTDDSSTFAGGGGGGMEALPAGDIEEEHGRTEGEEHDGDAHGQTDEGEASGAALVPVTGHNVRWHGDEQFENAAFEEGLALPGNKVLRVFCPPQRKKISDQRHQVKAITASTHQMSQSGQAIAPLANS